MALDMNAIVAAMRIAVREELTPLESQLNEVKSQLNEVKSQITRLEPQLRGEMILLRDEMNLLRGDINEKYLRSRIEKLYGSPFASKFVAQGLSGLARLVCPKKSVYPTGGLSFKSIQTGRLAEPDIVRQDKAVNKLLHALEDSKVIERTIFEVLKQEFGNTPTRASSSNAGIKWFEEIQKSEAFRNLQAGSHIDFQRDNDSKLSFADARAYWVAEFLKEKTPTGRKQFLKNDCGFGLSLYCARVSQNHAVVHNLDFDCRGSFSVNSTGISVYLAEIKSNPKCLSEATKQLKWKRDVMRTVINDIYGASMPVHFTMVIFMPFTSYDCNFDHGNTTMNECSVEYV